MIPMRSALLAFGLLVAGAGRMPAHRNRRHAGPDIDHHRERRARRRHAERNAGAELRLAAEAAAGPGRTVARRALGSGPAADDDREGHVAGRHRGGGGGATASVIRRRGLGDARRTGNHQPASGRRGDGCLVPAHVRHAGRLGGTGRHPALRIRELRRRRVAERRLARLSRRAARRPSPSTSAHTPCSGSRTCWPCACTPSRWERATTRSRGGSSTGGTTAG